MKEIRCIEHAVDDEHNVLVMLRNGLYECYVMQHFNNVETPFLHMFGLPEESVHGEQGAIEIAVANAPDYYDMFTDPYVDIGKNTMLM